MQIYFELVLYVPPLQSSNEIDSSLPQIGGSRWKMKLNCYSCCLIKNRAEVNPPQADKSS